MNRTETLAEYIFRVMREENLSYSDLVRRAEKKGFKITQSYLSKIVNEAAGDVSVGKLKAIAAGLGRREQEVFAVASGTQLEKDEVEDAMFNALAFGYKKLTDKDKERIAVLLKALEREIEESNKK